MPDAFPSEIREGVIWAPFLNMAILRKVFPPPAEKLSVAEQFIDTTIGFAPVCVRRLETGEVNWFKSNAVVVPAILDQTLAVKAVVVTFASM